LAAAPVAAAEVRVRATACAGSGEHGSGEQCSHKDSNSEHSKPYHCTRWGACALPLGQALHQVFISTAFHRRCAACRTSAALRATAAGAWCPPTVGGGAPAPTRSRHLCTLKRVCNTRLPAWRCRLPHREPPLAGSSWQFWLSTLRCCSCRIEAREMVARRSPATKTDSPSREGCGMECTSEIMCSKPACTPASHAQKRWHRPADTWRQQDSSFDCLPLLARAPCTSAQPGASSLWARPKPDALVLWSEQ